MARILYGVHGTGHGHAVRALSVARRFGGHQFLFVSHGDGAALLGRAFRVEEIPNPATPVRRHRVALMPLLRQDLSLWRAREALMGRVARLIDDFRPDVALTDYEFFVPRASRAAGIPCLSLDHQHVVTCCRHKIPLRQIPSYLATAWAIGWLFSGASGYVVTSFFRPPLRPGVRAHVLPPVLRDAVLGMRPCDLGHAVAYQGYPTFAGFTGFLRRIDRPVRVYGLGGPRREENLQFKAPSERGFLEDLATCSYVVCGGGHTLLSEALYLGKPVLSFPIRGAFEQFLNARYLQASGFGLCHPGTRPGAGLVEAMEGRLARFTERIRGRDFDGNSQVFALLSRFLENGALPEAPPGPGGSLAESRPGLQ
jgi:uncharacterized protein (TIGR00661 family)